VDSRRQLLREQQKLSAFSAVKREEVRLAFLLSFAVPSLCSRSLSSKLNEKVFDLPRRERRERARRLCLKNLISPNEKTFYPFIWDSTNTITAWHTFESETFFISQIKFHGTRSERDSDDSVVSIINLLSMSMRESESLLLDDQIMSSCRCVLLNNGAIVIDARKMDRVRDDAKY
jgi:hypothetical protein